jgi:uncharacterized protein (DUF1684 family)
MAESEFLELLDWRRRVASLFIDWREASAYDAAVATAAFRAGKDRLFAKHPQSPLRPEAGAASPGLDYWPYDGAYRMTVDLEPVEGMGRPHDDESSSGSPGSVVRPLVLPSSGPGSIRFRRIGRVRLVGPLAGRTLAVFWIDAYGGGLFLPFRDATSGWETYGAGRYLLDTIKSADHGGDMAMATLLLDFNLAFHPSCTYDPRWVCPLAPRENTLDVAVPVGERLSASG